MRDRKGLRGVSARWSGDGPAGTVVDIVCLWVRFVLWWKLAINVAKVVPWLFITDQC